MTVRFYMDEHVSRAVTVGLRRRGLDVLTVQGADAGYRKTIGSGVRHLHSLPGTH